MRLYVSDVSLQGEIPQNSYLQNIPAIKRLQDMRRLPLSSPVTFFVGENGTGKSTLLEAIAVLSKLNAEGGSRNFNFSTCRTESPLHEYLSVSKAAYEKDSFFLRAESFYNVATDILKNDICLDGYGGRSLHEQSHGESFLALVQNRFRGNGLYILDEPEAALSPIRQMTLLLEIRRLADKNSQFLIATHSPIVLSFPHADIWEFSKDGICKKAYTETENYQVMKDFINNRDNVLRHLFGED